MNERTDTVLCIKPVQYREYAEIAKAHGLALRLFDQPAQVIGLRSGLDACVIDATSDAVVGSLTEVAALLLSTTIDTGHIRRTGKSRFECDVSQLTDAEMYRFWLFHEIGHSADNYCSLSFQFSPAAGDPEFRRETLRRIWQANEILADRWAWAQVCDRPMPKTECGSRDEDAIEAELAFLDGVTGGRRNYTTGLKPHVEPGRYRTVPLRMLGRKDAHIWVGPDIDPSVKQRAVDYEARALESPANQLPEKLLINGITGRPAFRAGSSTHELSEVA
ncbi:hypothetical protein YH64_024490 [Achromobacter sp. LC458]|uniref:hypothetical protein n=1 Tax=Achromobacter sp. LC458 TaxID=1120623 RepID=UPI00062A3A8C|nr:hypothetical protein [Achromobacter sp. LC458]TRM50385.1 hypothetical protein YH64_024490 [Achromobacter sp. LC458]